MGWGGSLHSNERQLHYCSETISRPCHSHMYFFSSKFAKIRRECIKNHIYFIFSLDHLSYYTISVEDANVEMIPMSKLASFR